MKLDLWGKIFLERERELSAYLVERGGASMPVISVERGI
jgi:hypothetical protein